jgi:hypothetical protein
MPQLTARARSITEVSTAIGVNSVGLLRVLHLLPARAAMLLIHKKLMIDMLARGEKFH